MTTLDAMWQGMFIGSISASAFVVAVGSHIARMANTGRPEDQASLEERERRISIISIICSFLFIFYGILGMPYSLSVLNDYCELALKASYFLFLPTLVVFMVLLLEFGIIFPGNFPRLSHDRIEEEPVYAEFMNRQS